MDCVTFKRLRSSEMAVRNEMGVKLDLTLREIKISNEFK